VELIPVQGESSRVWIVDQRQPAGLQRRAAPFYGWEEGREEERVWVQRVAGGDLFDDDREHLRRAVRVAQLPGIADCPHVVRVLDIADPWDSYFFFELADTRLDEIDPLTAAETEAVGESIGQALAAVHAAGYVHCDVQPSNILGVRGVWKLSDFGAAVKIGAPIDALPRDRRFVPADVSFGAPATPALDLFGLATIIESVGGG
jgi:serine/threonine protein kinase